MIKCLELVAWIVLSILAIGFLDMVITGIIMPAWFDREVRERLALEQETDRLRAVHESGQHEEKSLVGE